MASAPAIHQNGENKLLTQNERPIASRLRSRTKIRDVQTSHTGEIDAKNKSDKPSQLSRTQKDKSKKSAAKKSEVHTSSTSRTTGQPSTDNPNKKSNDSTHKSSEVNISSSCTRSLPSKDQGTKKSKDSSETQRKQSDLKNQHDKSKASQPKSETKSSSTPRKSQNSKDQELKIKKIKIFAPKKSNIGEPSSSGLGKEKEKTIPSLKLHIKPVKEHQVHYIRWKGFGETSASYNCSSCEEDIAYLPNEEKRKNSINEQNELEYSILSRGGMEQGQCSMLSETAILPCGHVFHNTCLSESLMRHSEPPCPICLRML